MAVKIGDDDNRTRPTRLSAGMEEAMTAGEIGTVAVDVGKERIVQPKVVWSAIPESAN